MKVENITSGIGEFFRSLLPGLSRKDLVIDITHTYDELHQIVIPMYETDMSEFTFKGELAKSLDRMIRKSSIDFHKSSYATISKCLKQISDNEEEVIKMLESTFGKEIVKDALDYKKIQILNYVEALNFINEYSRRWILGVVTQEFDPNTAHRIVGPIDKATIAWAQDWNNMSTFIKVLEICAKPTKNFLNTVDKVEGLLVKLEEVGAADAVINKGIDPNGFGIIPVRMNPFFHIALAVNTWRVARYERNIEERAKLQLMVLALQEQQSKTQDTEKLTNLEKQIKYRSNQINIYTGKIEDMEDRG
jgi:hypothetical protein